MAALSTIEELIARATLGGEENKLDAEKRRLCLAFMVASPEHRDQSNSALARLFQVDEKTIRRDKDEIRKQAAEEITKDDIALVIADIRQAYERYCVELAQSKKLAAKGTRVWLDYHNAEMQMQLKVVEALQSLGYYPKNLGQMTQKKFVFKAHVARDGSTNTLPVVEGEEIKPKALPAPNRAGDDPTERANTVAALNAEFEDVPADRDAAVSESNGEQSEE